MNGMLFYIAHYLFNAHNTLPLANLLIPIPTRLLWEVFSPRCNLLGMRIHHQLKSINTEYYAKIYHHVFLTVFVNCTERGSAA